MYFLLFRFLESIAHHVPQQSVNSYVLIALSFQLHDKLPIYPTNGSLVLVKRRQYVKAYKKGPPSYKVVVVTPANPI